MRILVFSDTHHRIDDCIRLVNNIRPSGLDMILHAGDCNEDAEDLMSVFPEIDIRYVQGNNNFASVPYDMEIDAAGHKIFMSHGHIYRVKYDYSQIAEKAKSIGAEIAVFGHTHVPFCGTEKGMMLLNPGSVRYSRTYGVIEIENNKLRAAVIGLQSDF